MSCWSPITLKNNSVSAINTGKHMTVPCGKCLGCLQRKRADWTLRISYEERMCRSSAFVTLTYDDFNLPITDNGNVTLVKKHVQEYFKRVWHTTKYLKGYGERINKKGKVVKYKIWGSDLKYFAVGEYGSHTLRPHYHAAVFNADIEKLNEKWSDYKGMNNGVPNYVSKGFVQFGEVNPASIHYLTKYLVNEENEKDFLDAQEPFRLMSKGLGDGYQSDVGNYCVSNLSNIVPVVGGSKNILPRFISDKIFTKAEKWQIAEKAIQAQDKKRELPWEVVRDHHIYELAIARKTSKSNKC